MPSGIHRAIHQLTISHLTSFGYLDVNVVQKGTERETSIRQPGPRVLVVVCALLVFACAGLSSCCAQHRPPCQLHRSRLFVSLSFSPSANRERGTKFKPRFQNETSFRPSIVEFVSRRQRRLFSPSRSHKLTHAATHTRHVPVPSTHVPQKPSAHIFADLRSPPTLLEHCSIIGPLAIRGPPSNTSNRPSQPPPLSTTSKHH